MQTTMIKEKKVTTQIYKQLASIICILLIVTPMAVVCARYDGLYFLLYLAFWVMIPGYLFLHLLKNNGLECKTNSLGFIYSFLLGSGSLFIEFFILHAFGSQNIELIKYINPLLCIFSVVLFYRTHKNKTLALPNIKHYIINIPEQLPFLVLWLVATWLCAATLNFFMPTVESVFYTDFTWHIGNVNQLASAYPFEDIRVAGAEFKYHYFNMLFYAIEKIIFDISGWVIFSQHQVMIIPLLISLCFYTLFSSVTNNKWGVVLLSLFTYTGFSTSHHYNGFMYHLISNINAIGLATIASCALFFVIKPLLATDVTLNKKSIIHIAFAAILIAYLAGAKGPFGIIFITAIICYIIMRLLRKTKPSITLLTLLLLTFIAFASIYMALLSNGASSYLSENLFNGILGSVNRVLFFDKVPYFSGLRVVMLIPSLLFTFTLVLFPLILCAWDCVLYVFGKKDLSPTFIFACLLTVIGTTAFYFFQLAGSGQLYFLHCSIPFIGYLTIHKMTEIFKTRPTLRKVSVFLTICFTISGLHFNFLVPRIEFSLSMPLTYFTNQNPSIEQEILQEHEAFEYLKNYSKDDKYVFPTRVLEVNTTSATYHDVSAFTEKRTYLEGYAYAEVNLGFTETEQRLTERANMFGNTLTTEEKHTFASEHNIGYLLIFKNDIYEEFELTPPETGEFFELIFENDSVSIYEIM